MITRELLLDRIAELKKLQENALANANALSGALQDCEFWLGVLDKEDKAPSESPPNSIDTNS